jgi:hypothetical protein
MKGESVVKLSRRRIIMDYTGNAEVDIEAHPTTKKLVGRCRDFFGKIDNL